MLESDYFKTQIGIEFIQILFIGELYKILLT